MFKRILVALDGSENSSRASQAALELAEKLKAELIVLHAITPLHLLPHRDFIGRPGNRTAHSRERD